MTDTQHETDEDHDHHDNAGTTHEDWRWKGLSTLWCIVYGLGFPAYLALTQHPAFGFQLLPGMAMTPLFLAWGATVVYIIGARNVETWKSLTTDT